MFFLGLIILFFNPFTLKISLFSNSPYCLPYSSYDVSLENLVLDRLVILSLIFSLFSSLFCLHCINIVRRSSVLVTQKSWEFKCKELNLSGLTLWSAWCTNVHNLAFFFFNFSLLFSFMVAFLWVILRFAIGKWDFVAFILFQGTNRVFLKGWF